MGRLWVAIWCVHRSGFGLIEQGQMALCVAQMSIVERVGMDLHQEGQGVEGEENLCCPGPLQHEWPTGKLLVFLNYMLNILHLKIKTHLTQRINHADSNRTCRAIPPRFHRSNPRLLQHFCRGKTIPLLTTMARSLRPSDQTFSDKRLHTLTLNGYPVSLMFRSTVVPTMIARAIQNRVKNPRKL